MPVRNHHSSSWASLVESLGGWIASVSTDPFVRPTVIVSSRSVARILPQELALVLPAGICAGISFVTMADFVASRAARHGVGDELRTWRSSALDLACAEGLLRLAEGGGHRQLHRYLSVDVSPDRLHRLAQRTARMLRHYAVEAPGLLAEWASGRDIDGDGNPLPSHRSWQAEVHRFVVERLEVDPVGAMAELTASLGAAEAGEPLAVFAVSELPRSHRELIAALARNSPVAVWSLDGAAGGQHAAGPETESVAVGPVNAAGPRVAVHAAAGRTRQVEVLRDLLTRWFAEHPDAEPRDVVVVASDPAAWAPLLRSAFEPVTLGDQEAHPGRRLRVQVANLTQPNLVTAVVRQALTLHRSRATATEVVDLMLSRPVAHRWQLDDRRDDIIALVARAQVRWGLDAAHRQVHGVPGLSQNTWVRGLDRMLAGLAMPPDAHSLTVTGVAAINSTDLTLVGTLAEIVSRLRRFSTEAQAPATVTTWAGRIHRLLDELVAPAFDDEWMLVETAAAVSDLAGSLAGSPTELTRSEFGILFDQATSEFPARPVFGNGSLQVIAPADLQHVHKRLVCLLGVSDDGVQDDADLVPLGPGVPTRRQLELRRLLDQARSADDVVALHSDRDPCTGVAGTVPVTLSWLLRELGGDHATTSHALLAHSDQSFSEGTFDPSALAAANGLRRPTGVTAHGLRRLQALALPVPAGATELRLGDIQRALKDPAKEFLTARMGMRLFEPDSLVDELPFVEDGLVMWGVRSRLLGAIRRGLTRDEALDEERRRETMPPGEIGRGRMHEASDLVARLHQQAVPDWDTTIEDHSVRLDLGDGLVVRDTVRTRGGSVVELEAGTGPKVWLAGWLAALALTAAGRPTAVVIHQLHRHFGDVFPTQHRLQPPSPIASSDLLRHAASAARQAPHRLLPLPLDAALEAARQLAESPTGFDIKPWQLPTSDWKCPWRYPAEHWRLFYPSSPAELFDDAPTPLDPPSSQSSAFLAWVEAVHLPMLRGKQ